MNDFRHMVIKSTHNPESWDHYVRTDPESDYCHLFDWSRVIEKVYHHQPLYLAAVDTGTNKESVCGIFPIFQFRSLGKRPKLVSIPFFDNAGILARTPEIKRMLFLKALGILKNNRCSTLEIRRDKPSVFSDFPITENLQSKVSTLKVGLKLKLGLTSPEMMLAFRSKLRSQIRKGMKNGLKADVGKEELLGSFYEVFSRNMRDLGSPVHSRKFFESIFTHFKTQSFICIVNYKSRPVAAGFMFQFKNEIKNPWSSSIKEYRHLNSNMLMYWEMIRFACDTGQQFFDMGRSSKGATTYHFKKQWEPQELQLYWYNWFLDRHESSETVETLKFRFWNRLPLKIANVVGPLVRRNISL